MTHQWYLHLHKSQKSVNSVCVCCLNLESKGLTLACSIDWPEVQCFIFKFLFLGINVSLFGWLIIQYSMLPPACISNQLQYIKNMQCVGLQCKRRDTSRFPVLDPKMSWIVYQRFYIQDLFWIPRVKLDQVSLFLLKLFHMSNHQTISAKNGAG